MSVKTAVPDYPILDLIAKRWSPRAFADRPVESEKLRSLFEAARWAASSFNGQPWRFFVSTRDDAEGFEKLASCLNPGNAWAKKAPVLALSVASLNFEHNNAPNRSAVHDVGLAVGNLSLQAISMGIYLHQMAGFSVDAARQLLGIPDGYVPVAMIAIGYLGDPGTLPDDLQAREMAVRQRKPLAEFVFSGRWGSVAGIVAK
jgi:nitroreductase